MASPLRISVVQNSNNIKLIFTIKKDGIVESLLGAVIKLQFINKKTEQIMYRECTITDPSAAECAYILTQNDLLETGSFLTEFEVEYSNGTKLAVQNPIVLSILPEIVPS